MNNSTQVCSSLQYSPIFILLAGVSAISGIICVVGNAVVIWTIYKTKTLQCVSYILISSLAFADGLVGLLCNPILAVRAVLFSYLEYSNDIPIALDVTEDFLWIQGILVSTFSLTAISIDRFIAITKSIYYQSIMTMRRCRVIVILAWVAPTITAFLRILPLKDEYLKWLWLATVIMAVFFPLSITSYCYFKIFTSAREQAKKLDPDNIRNTKAAKTMAIVIGVFGITYFPSIVLACLHAFKAMDECELLRVNTTAWPWVSCIAYASSAMNPWIYSMRLTAFRQATRKALRLKHENAK